ncbi:AAA family ATPase [Arenibacter sp. ARW7G5Y1]|uniref:AAA family ATPase n=1 Tax=Arenibacter sp. ARW7G5Y1 TaxID=2135619 RepID=UPI000D75E5CA|nr:AAA family ATPase [Arenibacter sp. ARW7G5Y1]PXX22852.1 signal recognition particle subunit FFH/SRP54 (srp54) [Arenibacter sp. ARW7G5Y1]
MKLRQSERKKAKIRLALQGPSGAGKTYSALLLAKGLSGGDISKVAVISSENGSADLYSNLYSYNVLTLPSPFSPEKYIEAIALCETSGMEVIIIDSISHCWEFLLEYHSSLIGNSFTNWSKVTPRHKSFVERMLQSSCHIIATIRTKQGYVLNQKDGKYIPEKVGLKAVQKSDIEYEFTLVFDIDIKHKAIASKDRTSLFMDKPEFIINSSTGRKILDWCNSTMTTKELTSQVSSCVSLDELTNLYRENPDIAKIIEQDFIEKRNLLQELINPKNYVSNGTTNSHPKS